jgi:hypothetical protein
MSYTHKSLALVWLLLLGFFGLAGSGAAGGLWLILLIAAALVMPALISNLNAKPPDRSNREVPLPPARPVAVGVGE